MEEKTIAPIQTYYSGYHFRSRLEARWAVFFDEIGVEYEYEPEGFKLSDGAGYLPDFYLPQFLTYVEIKHAGLSEEDRKIALHKCEQLSWEVDCFILFCEGDPLENNLKIFCTHYTASGCASDWYKCEFISEAETDVKLAVWFEGEHCWGKGKFYYSDGSCLEPITNYKYCSNDKVRPIFELDNNYDFLSEKQLARQARFEHGETPQTSNAHTITTNNIVNISPKELSELALRWRIDRNEWGKENVEQEKKRIEEEKKRIEEEIFKLIPEAFYYTPFGTTCKWRWTKQDIDLKWEIDKESPDYSWYLEYPSNRIPPKKIVAGTRIYYPEFIIKEHYNYYSKTTEFEYSSDLRSAIKYYKGIK